ncbi:MAG TPA: GNAT family N-acetyltransferase [Candidatus Kryptonia bacterium]
MKLIRPSRKYEASWKEALREFDEENVTGFWNYPDRPSDIDSYIRGDADNSRGRNLVEGWVPSTTFWLIDRGMFIGHVNIRHELNLKLKEHGGHIGYAIRPTQRRKGYGNKILGLVLPEVKKLGIRTASIMCEDSNIGSRRIIENNGGALQEIVTHDDKIIRKYLIEIR